MNGLTALLIAAAAGAVFVLVRSRFWQWGPCPACKGRRGRGWGSAAAAYSRCARCGGSGERIRPLAMIWPKHRETARRLKEAREARKR